MIEIKNLNKKFKKKSVLNNINIKFDNGVYGFLGANGAGKTTLLRCLTLLYSEGFKSIYFNDKPAIKDKEFLNKVGYLPQQFGLFNELTVFEGMQLLANFKGVKKSDAIDEIEKCLELVNLTQEKDKKIRELSGGMIRRLGIAQALLNNPEIIIFDEPTAGLDPMERLRFKSVISKIKNNKTIIVSTHIVEDVEAVCDYVIIIDNGEIKGCMSCIELQNLAEGKVFEIPESEIKNIESKIYIERTYKQDGVMLARILSAKRQDCHSCPATIEDGYLCLINNI